MIDEWQIELIRTNKSCPFRGFDRNDDLWYCKIITSKFTRCVEDNCPYKKDIKK